MKRIFILFLAFSPVFCLSQTDFSSNWEDFYSYNNVKDFTKVGDKIYAAADNAVFIYDVITQEIEKLSSVQGLSGESTSSIYFDEATEKLVIGYETGLIEVVDNEGKITISNDIERLSITGEKQINDIASFGNKVLLATPFAVVEYDIDRLEFGDTYFIGNGSSEVKINEIKVFQDRIYAATELGVFSADANNPNLIDFNNWLQPQEGFTGNFKTMEVFNNELFTSKTNELFKVTSTNTLQSISLQQSEVLNLYASDDFLTVTSLRQVRVFNTSMNIAAVADPTNEFNYSLNNAYAENDILYLGTSEFGILQRTFIDPIAHIEIHPSGPISNDIFSITAENNNVWVVYGGYDGAFTPLGFAKDVSHFNGEDWIKIPFNNSFPARDLVNVTIDPENENKVYVSSWSQNGINSLDHTGGILVIENDEPSVFWNQDNSGLESVMLPNIPTYRSVRVNGTAFDNQGNFWVTNGFIDNRLKKLAPNGTWSSFDLSSIMTNSALGLTELVIDRTGSVWMGSRRNGVLVFNESGNRMRALTTELSRGSLPDAFTPTVAVDRNNRIWIGTRQGLVVFSNAGGLFEATTYDANPVIIEDDGVARRLLGEELVTSIAIDGADNKWFGTATGGVIATNPSGQETLYTFNASNSPLPSNRIVKVKVDDTTGKVYFATDKGLVAFDSNVTPFGDELGEVYAYPNPVKKEHSVVTIDGRNGTHLPRGTNVKILDSSGRLVHETNVIEGQELSGGKVVWNKTNLAGKRVASGIYIVLLTLPDRSETSSTKIAIIN